MRMLGRKELERKRRKKKRSFILVVSVRTGNYREKKRSGIKVVTMLHASQVLCIQYQRKFKQYIKSLSLFSFDSFSKHISLYWFFISSNVDRRIKKRKKKKQPPMEWKVYFRLLNIVIREVRNRMWEKKASSFIMHGICKICNYEARCRDVVDALPFFSAEKYRLSSVLRNTGQE